MPEPKHNPKRKRRCLTYSLRTFLLVVTIACVAFGYWAHLAAKQKAAVEWVKANGGTCYYGHEIDDNGIPLKWNDKTPVYPYPKWAHRLLGDDFFANVVVVRMSGNDLSEIEPLAALDHLRRLSINRAKVSDLTPLAALTRLESLHIEGTQVSDLTPLAKLTSVRFLNISGTQVSDLAPLAGLTRLESLHIGRTQVTDLSPLAKLTRLESLVIFGTHVSDPTPLKGLKNLQIIR